MGGNRIYYCSIFNSKTLEPIRFLAKVSFVMQKCLLTVEKIYQFLAFFHFFFVTCIKSLPKKGVGFELLYYIFHIFGTKFNSFKLCIIWIA